MSSALQLPRERVLALDPANVEAYLVAHGWQVDPEVSSPEAGIYHLPADPQAEVIVPRDKGFADYALRVGEALRAVAVAECRKAWEVLEDLSRQQGMAPANGPATDQRRPKSPAPRGKRDPS
jgi:hypothetical protein